MKSLNICIDKQQKMERVIQILNKTQFGFLATLDEGKPRVRPFQFQFETNGEFFFCTAREKEVAKQLIQNPIAEYAAYDKAFNYVRISGEILFSDDLMLKARVLNDNPYYKTVFGSANNASMVLFYFGHGQVLLGSLDSYPPEMINF